MNSSARWRRFAMIAAIAALPLIASRPARGHAVHVFAETEGPQIVGVVYFSGGGKAIDVEVELLAADDTAIAVARTDRTGQFAFVAPAPGAYRIVTRLAEGHRGGCAVEVISTSTAPAESVAELRSRVQDRPGRTDRIVWAVKVAGGLACIAGVFAAGWCLRRRRRPGTAPGEDK